jgi:hypothetical protein
MNHLNPQHSITVTTKFLLNLTEQKAMEFPKNLRRQGRKGTKTGD